MQKPSEPQEPEIGSLTDGEEPELDEDEEEMTAAEFVTNVLSSWDEEGVPVVVEFGEESLNAVRSLQDAASKLTKAVNRVCDIAEKFLAARVKG